MKALSITTGILTVILGIFALTMPFRAFLGFGWVFGILLIVNAIELAVEGFSKKKSIWQGIFGILLGICGFILLINGFARFATDLFLAYLIGIAVAVSGISMVVNAIATFKASKGRAVLFIICGILSVVLGIAAVTHPILTMISAGIIIGITIIMHGIDYIVYGFDKKDPEAK